MTAGKRTTVHKCSWSAEEDAILANLVAVHGPKHWSLIAQSLKGRIGKQCRERWHNHLNPSVRKDAWTPEEDALIISLVDDIGTKWASISKHLHGRTDNSTKNRYYSSLKKKHDAHKALLLSSSAQTPRLTGPCHEPSSPPSPTPSPLSSCGWQLASPIPDLKKSTAKAERKRKCQPSISDAPPSKRERRTSCVSVTSVAESLPDAFSEDEDACGERIEVMASPNHKASTSSTPQVHIALSDGPSPLSLNDAPASNKRKKKQQRTKKKKRERHVAGLQDPVPEYPVLPVVAQPQQPGCEQQQSQVVIFLPVLFENQAQEPAEPQAQDDKEAHEAASSQQEEREEAHEARLRMQHNALWAHNNQVPEHTLQQQEQHQHSVDWDNFPSPPLPPLALELQYRSMLQV